MIRFALKCAEGHVFDSWFASSAAYDALKADGLLSCGICGGGGVEKTLMAPALAHGGERPGAEDAAPASASASASGYGDG